MSPSKLATCFECERKGKIVFAHYKAKVKLRWMKDKITVYLCEEHLSQCDDEVINDAEKIHKAAANKSELIGSKRKR